MDIWAEILDQGLQIDAVVEGSGPPGRDALLNGENVLELRAGDNVSIRQEAGVMTISARGGYQIGSGLKLEEETNTLSVDTAAWVEEDNTRPITSAAVYETVGNIQILLETI